ncbi:MAG: flagellar protein export ATPase FliI [Pseudomonadota bacterium]
MSQNKSNFNQANPQHDQFNNKLLNSIQNAQLKLSNQSSSLLVEGKLTRMVGLTMEAIGCSAILGSKCLVEGVDGKYYEAEVVGFDDEILFLMPTTPVYGVIPGARVIPTNEIYHVNVGMELLGRVLDGNGQPLDGKILPELHQKLSLNGELLNPLLRTPISKPIDVGVRAINALITVGRGQRMGLFAGSGVGKSVLLGMMTKYSDADVIVVALIGERGREVKEFIQKILGKEGMARAVIVAVPADQSPVMRLHGAQLACSITEYFRDQGLHVLLLMDSLTRYAQAQREIALAIGEPPATKGYPPSVFAKLPALVERAGNSYEGGGSITAFYTVLTEGDDQQDPIADASRAILDGHIVLSRQLAEMGHYPAIDIEASISRVMPEVASDEHQFNAIRFKQIYSVYQQNKDLISVGAYSQGSDAKIDESIFMRDIQANFLQQSLNHGVNLNISLNELMNLMEQETPSQVVIPANISPPAITPNN